MAQLRSSILFTLLGAGGMLLGLALIYVVFYDSEKFEGNRYVNSYAEFSHVELTARQRQAIELLKSQGIEWAHFHFIDAIKNNNVPIVRAFIDAGMPLNSSSILLEVALGSSHDKKEMLSLLHRHYQLNLNELYELPNYVSKFDKQLAAVSKPYITKQKVAYREAVNLYKLRHVTWEGKLKNKKREMLSVCTNDACRSGRIHDVQLMFADTEPQQPVLNYISKERVKLSLLTVFVWQKDRPLVEFIQQQGGELIPNKLFLTDGTLIYFTVDADGVVTTPDTVN